MSAATDAVTYWQDRRAGRLWRFWAGDTVQLDDGRAGTVGSNYDMWRGTPQGCWVQLVDGSELDMSALDLTCARCGVRGGHDPLSDEFSASSEDPGPAASTPVDGARGWLHRHWLGALVGLAGLLMGTGLLGVLVSR
jgi:hypothetical protein